MHENSFRRQGDPVTIGWGIGRAPLALRGIRFADGENGGTPAAPAVPAAPATQPAGTPNPASVAAMVASVNGTPAPAAPAPQIQTIQGFTTEQVQKLMADNTAAQQALAAMQTERDEARTERDTFKGQVAEHARVGAITTAAADKANAALLLDSSKFQAAIKDLDVTDAAKIGAAVDQFVKDNPAYAATPAAPAIPHTSGGTPAGGTTSKPNTLQAAVAARLGA